MHGRLLALAALLALALPSSVAAKPPRYAAKASVTDGRVTFSFADRRASRVRFSVCVAKRCVQGRTGRKGAVKEVSLALPAGSYVGLVKVRRKTVKRVRFTVPPAPVEQLPGPTLAPLPPLVGSAQTTGCQSGLTWRIGYRMYRADDAGGTTTAEKRRAVQDAQQVWADRVGDLSLCAARVDIDVYDMGDTVARAGQFQDDPSDLRGRGDYDVLFDLVPQVANPGYVEKTNGYEAVFLDVADNPGLPSQDVHLHAWLHSVELFYVNVDFPGAGVHGYNGSVPGYSNADTNAYYRDFLRGALPKANTPGTCLGMLPATWAKYGTPRHVVPSSEFDTGHPCP